MILRSLPDELRELVLKQFYAVENGFCWEEKALKLAEVIWTFHPKVAIEIGVFGGKSFLPMAAATTFIDQNRGKYTCYGVDVWEGSEAAKNYPSPHKEYWSNQQLLDVVFEQCTRYIEGLNNEHIKLVKTTSKEFVKEFKDGEVEMLHIDGNHSEQESYDDIINWWPKLAKGGVFILDDIGWVSEAGVNYCKERGSIIWEYFHTQGQPWGDVIFFIKEKE